MSGERWATVLSVGVAIAVLATVRPSRAYDADVLLHGAEVTALIWAGLFAGRAYHTQQAALKYERQRDTEQRAGQRQALAIAMQVEATSLTDVVTILQMSGTPLREESGLVLPVIDRALQTAEVFQPLTVHRMADLMHHIARLRAAIAEYWGLVADVKSEGPVGRTGREPTSQRHATGMIAGAAQLALDRLTLLQTELENEASEHPQIRPMPLIANMNAPLPSPLRMQAQATTGRPPRDH